MRIPKREDFDTFGRSFDHVRPFGWPVTTGSLTNGTGSSTLAALRRTVVGSWLLAQEHYRVASRSLERSAFFRTLTDDESRIFAGARLAIDAGCAIGQYAHREQLSQPAGEQSHLLSQATTDDRRHARQIASELRSLMDRGIDLASENRTRDLYWSLVALEAELDAQLNDTLPITAPQRRDQSFEKRVLVYALTRRFFASFLEPLPSVILHLVAIVVPDGLDERTIRKICRDLQQRRDKAPGTLFAKPPVPRDSGS